MSLKPYSERACVGRTLVKRTALPIRPHSAARGNLRDNRVSLRDSARDADSVL